MLQMINDLEMSCTLITDSYISIGNSFPRVWGAQLGWMNQEMDIPMDGCTDG